MIEKVSKVLNTTAWGAMNWIACSCCPSHPDMEGASVLEHPILLAMGMRELDWSVFFPSRRAGGGKHKRCTLPSPVELFFPLLQ